MLSHFSSCPPRFSLFALPQRALFAVHASLRSQLPASPPLSSVDHDLLHFAIPYHGTSQALSLLRAALDQLWPPSRTRARSICRHQRAELSRQAPPPAIRALGLDPKCTPSFLYYPNYLATLNIPAPLTPQLLPPKSVVASAYRQTRRCFHPDKARRHKGLDKATLKAINVLLGDAMEKLLMGEGYPRCLKDEEITKADRERGSLALSEYSYGYVEYDLIETFTKKWLTHSIAWNTFVNTTLPHYAHNCTCGVREAIQEFGQSLVRPYWKEEEDLGPGPTTVEELADYCTCSLGIALAPWRFVLRWRWLPVPHTTFHQDHLPPRNIHSFWDSKELKQLARENWIAWAMQRWSRGWMSEDSVGRRLWKEWNLPVETRHRLVREGWYASSEFRMDEDYRKYVSEI